MTAALRLTGGRIGLADGSRAFALEIASLEVRRGEAVALSGASGSGKTLLLELLGLLRAPGAGTVYGWSGEGGETDLAALWRAGPRSPALARLRGALFGFVPQTGGLMPFLNVAENIALPQKVNNRRDDAWCRGLMARLGLADVARLHPGALSIGQRQRTAIARALAHRPPFVIADEPTAALDPDSADTVLELLLEAARGQDTGVILSSHDSARTSRFGLRRLHLVSQADGERVTSRLEADPC